jgi:hypothetical protein
MTPVALYITPRYIASVQARRDRGFFEGTVRFIDVDALPFAMQHVCLPSRDTALDALYDAVRDAERLLDAISK